MRSSKVVSIVVSIGLVVASLAFILNFQAVYDWYRLRGYTPPEQISSLAEATTMTSHAERLFYVNQPELNDKQTFRQNCTSNEATIVLGCYVSNQGIYIYDVNDKRLDGIEEVTAAHEMLHVGYERLSDDERARIDTLTAEAFAKVTDERLIGTVEQYQKADPSVVPNELHSILGTELADLPDELEQYYKRYFTDRKAVVKLANRYESAFRKREAAIERYDAELRRLETQIASSRAELNGLGTELQLQRQQLDRLIDSNPSSYNALVPEYNANVRAYNSLLESTNAAINQYNDIVKARNKVALEERDLQEALDSRVTPQTN